MENVEAIDLLEGVTKGMNGPLCEAIRKGAEALKQIEGICENGACTIRYSEEVIRVKYDDGIDHIEKYPIGDLIDLRTAEDVTLFPGDYKRISLGVAMKLPPGYEAWILPRSSTFEKWGVILTNGAGIIDESYCGNNDKWQFPVYATRIVKIPKNTRICQFRIFKHQPKLRLEEVESLEDPDRGGFGTTDDETILK